MLKRSRGVKSFSFVIIALLIGTVTYFFLNPKKAINLLLPDINHINFVKAKIKNDTIYVKINTVLQNKSLYKLTIDSLFCEIKLHDTTIIKEKLFIDLVQKRRQIDTLEIPVRLPMKKIVETLKNIQGTDSTELELNFYVIYNTIFGITKLPFSKKIKIITPIPPEVRIIKIDRNKINLQDKTVEIVAHVEIKNKGKIIDLKLKNVYYNIHIEDLISSKGSLPHLIVVKPGSTTFLEIPLLVKIDRIFKTSWLIATNNDKLSYNLDMNGELETEGFLLQDVPFLINVKGVTELKKE